MGSSEAVGTVRLVRRRSNRLAGGVAGGVADALGVDEGAVRVAFLLLAVAGGAGAVVYAFAWVVLPPADSDATPPRRDVVSSGAVVALAAGAVLVLRAGGMWFSDAVAVAGFLGVTGVAVVWGGGRWSPWPARREARPARLAVGLSLVFAAAALALLVSGGFEAIGPGAIGLGVVVGGLGLLVGPWLIRLTTELTAERRERIRSDERAHVAAHLHDGVLQTLALIQRRAADEREVRGLARRQERELRDWLYGRPTSDATTLAALLRRELAEIEDRYAVRVDAVIVGDAPLDDSARALVAAGREAVLNAARHAGVDVVDAYLEVEPQRLSLYIRDRGCGFDPKAVPDDRHGLADSVTGRVRRVGGSALVRSAPGEGTEVELTVPRNAA